MPTPVNRVPTNFALSGVQVGNPVSSAHLLRWAEECSFNGGFNTQAILAMNLKPRAAARTQLKNLGAYKVPFVYYRSPGARILAVVVSIAPGTVDTGSTVTLAMTLPSGAAWVEANGLDGSVNFRFPPDGRVAQGEVVGYLDVSGVTASTATFGSLNVTLNTGTVSQGILRLTILEVPLASSNVTGVPSEPILEQAWTLSPNRLVDGGPSSPRGLNRLAYLMDQYRSGFRPHIALSSIESTQNTAAATNPHWYREGGFGALEWQYNVTGAHDPRFHFQVRNLYGVGAGAASQTYTLHVRYKTSGAVGGTLGTYLAGVGGTALGVQDTTLGATSNVWTWTSRTVTVPADGTGGLVQMYFDCNSGGAGNVLQIANITLVDSEP